MSDAIYNSEFTLKGKTETLAQWKDQPILVINTATKCGLAPQFKALEALHQEFGEQGLKVIGFPCNQFKDQEPETNDSMAGVCEINFGVTFDLAAKVDVNGSNTHAIYQALKNQAPGLLGSKGIKWNFTKFLISPNGEKIVRFAPTTKPEAIKKHIEALLPVKGA
jgi:glutathione peroxidase